MKRLVSLLATGLMLVATVGLANATTMTTTNLNDVFAAGGVAVAIPEGTLTSLTDPFGGSISFSREMAHRRVGSGWATWSDTYGDPSGLDILYSMGATSVTITFAPNAVEDFGFELEPNPFELITFTLGLDDGSILTQDVHGSAGALAFGFLGGAVEWLTISGDSDFAIGRLTIDSVAPVPEPSTIFLLCGGLVGLAIWRKRKQNT